jgi:hypothetical protein
MDVISPEDLESMTAPIPKYCEVSGNYILYHGQIIAVVHPDKPGYMIIAGGERWNRLC